MGKTLIIAEKPSVAGDLAKALGKFQKHEDHFENDDYVISSAVVTMSLTSSRLPL